MKNLTKLANAFIAANNDSCSDVISLTVVVATLITYLSLSRVDNEVK